MRYLLLLSIMLSALYSTQLDNRLNSIINNEPYQLSQNSSERNIIRQLYSLNQNRPLWIGHARNLNTLRETLQDPYFNYKYKDLHQSKIEQYTYLLHDNMDLNTNANDLATLDILLTRAYVGLANFIVQSDTDWDMVQEKIKGLKESKDITANWEMVRKVHHLLQDFLLPLLVKISMIFSNLSQHYQNFIKT